MNVQDNRRCQDCQFQPAAQRAVFTPILASRMFFIKFAM